MSRTNRRGRRYGHLPELGEINVMPLVDLFMQLFIAVVIFFPVVEYGLNINLPKGTTNTIKREQTRTLSVDSQGRVFLNDVPMTLPELRTQLSALANVQPPVTILVKADQANNYGAVMSVLKELHAARITRIALMTQEETPARVARR
ncbi:MAG: biopolymer transporter ExbD [Verrucomicrobiae bacterium]|nr:biopolymer transporter ExbD [Verrucomicrobiae bacterium]MDW8343311.1 biopolymer transporter ExbD [Verrucomicrobiae bacterium]